jgi:hypothetical protein
MMITLALATAVMATVLGGSAEAGDRVSEAYSKQLDLVEHDIVGLAEAMPADKYDFRPQLGEFAGVRTFGEQISHVATMIYMTAAIVRRERSPYGPGVNDNGPATILGKDQIVAYLKDAIAYARTAIAALDEHNHLDTVNTFFGSQTRAEVAAGLIYHSYDHYGQMVVYARMNGIVPPASRR